MAVVVALFLLGGTVQAANFHVGSSAAVELADRSVDLVVPVAPVLTVAPIRHTITIVMPSVDDPITSSHAPRAFRPPRG